MNHVVGRYDGKPFLRLMECYVLHCIGQLNADDYGTLQKLEPKLRQTFGMDGSWSEIIRAEMAFPDNLPHQLNLLWRENVEAAALEGVTLDANAFAVAVIDRHFPDLA